MSNPSEKDLLEKSRVTQVIFISAEELMKNDNIQIIRNMIKDTIIINNVFELLKNNKMREYFKQNLDKHYLFTIEVKYYSNKYCNVLNVPGGIGLENDLPSNEIMTKYLTSNYGIHFYSGSNVDYVHKLDKRVRVMTNEHKDYIIMRNEVITRCKNIGIQKIHEKLINMPNINPDELKFINNNMVSRVIRNKANRVAFFLFFIYDL